MNLEGKLGCVLWYKLLLHILVPPSKVSVLGILLIFFLFVSLVIVACKVASTDVNERLHGYSG